MTNTSLSNLVLIATLSSSVVSLSHDTSLTLLPAQEATYDSFSDIASWKDAAFSTANDYSFYGEEGNKINTMLSFTKTILENTKDIDSEFVDIVNENFWDLV